MWKNLIRPGLILLLVVIGCGVAARFLAGEETLADYAEKNPEIAYGSAQSSAGHTEEEAAAPADAGATGHAAGGLADAGMIDNAPDRQTDAGTIAHAAEETAADPVRAASEERTPGETADAELQAGGDAGGAISALTDDSDVADARVTYADGFFYEPIPAAVFRRMSGNSYPEDCPVPLDALRYLNVRYIDFNDEEQIGEIVCGEAIAADLTEIFCDLYEARYQMESVRLIDDYGGDDDASMLDNNTSCFNYRTVAGSSTLSNHAKGLAIDINPFYNPWVNHGKVSPPEAAEYADRTRDFPHKIDRDDFCCQCFLNHGFFWGGNWNNPDYQHFQKN